MKHLAASLVILLANSFASAQVSFTPLAIPKYVLGVPYNSGQIRAASPTGPAFVNYHIVSKLPAGLKVGYTLPETGRGVGALYVYGRATEIRKGVIRIIGRDVAGNVAVRYYYLIPK